ncbi:malate dehydrogenase (oxaloacetate-decarboxylating) [Natronobacillus azotifigens]|uniref:NAD-dependent malic enzyme n=1 Tax=Natronobacillus azotifigens TaxID=472978 RepID=A0A9J6RCC4_9BACI|nr:malic enzyme-like NAD(P)-binding protein [Natronobacillus azotifigens]MCZ0703191.1 NAD-dependent malic enzyme [Natronobacillus azotifigens]
MTRLRDQALQMHEEKQGKLSVQAKVPVANEEDLSLAYSPGVAEPCLEIEKNQDKAYTYTMKANMVGVVTDGSAVLGLGNIGAQAALPVMEGKAVLFKNFGDVDAFPICLDTQDVDQVIETVKLLAPTFGGINLEDIAAPNCFAIEEALKEQLDIPVFHDDQHGTAIVTLAGLFNALKLVNKSFETIKVVINGAGAAGIAIVKLLAHFGVNDMILCDSKGAIYQGRSNGMNTMKEEIASFTNKNNIAGDLRTVMEDADVFIGVSLGGLVDEAMIRSMKQDPIVFAMANPDPEILPELAIKAGAAVVGTGRSDYPNQVNNVLAFPGIFRGALDVRSSDINEEMKVAAVEAIAMLIKEDELRADYVIPNPFDERVAPAVAKAVAKAAKNTGVARID